MNSRILSRKLDR